MAAERSGWGGTVLFWGLIVALGGGGLALSSGRAPAASAPAAPAADGHQQATGKAGRGAGAEPAAPDVPWSPRNDVYGVLETFAGLQIRTGAAAADSCARVTESVGAICRLGYPNVRVMLATVPDPKDSRFVKFFDDQVSAMRMALERSGFVGDRFYDPWQQPDGAGDPSSPLHWRQPGMLLFRRNETRELLILLLVGETPTWGVHREALRTALDIANAVLVAPCGAVQESIVRVEATAVPADLPARTTLPILGPAMSGTTESLRVTITDWFKEQRFVHPRARRCGSGVGPPFDLEFISGSATVDDNQGTLGHDLAAGIRSTFPRFNSSFQATVHPESAQQRFVLDYLVYRLGLCRIAVLTESSTSYGEGFTKAARKNESRSLICKDGLKVRLTGLPFPLHISKLKGAVQNEGTATNGSSASVPRRLRALERDDDVSSPDAFPAKSRVTQSASEISLEEVLEGIATEDVQAVVIVASSTSDVLFLVEKVRRSFPNVTIVVNDADIIFLHDDVPFMEGVLSASTYTLTPWTQRLTFPFEGDSERLLFPSSSAKGTYNATLWLIDGFTRVAVLDYGSPFAVPRNSFWPAQWMTVVSKGAFWPLAARAGNGVGYVQRAEAGVLSPDQIKRTMWTLPHNYPFLVVSILLLLLDVLFLGAYLRGQARRLDESSVLGVAGALFLPAQVFPHENVHRFELLALLGTSLVVNAGFFAVWLVVTLPPMAVVPQSSTIITGLFALQTLALLVLTGHALVRWLRVKERLRAPLAIGLALATLVAVAAVAAPRIEALRSPAAGGERIVSLMFFIERARNLDSGVSLLWMALLLGIGHAMWNLGHLRQVRIVEDAAVLRRLGVLPRDTAGAAGNDPNDEPVLERLGVAAPMRAVVAEAEGVLPSRFGAILMLLVFGDAIWISRGLPFFESPVLGWACAGAYGLLLALIVYGCARYLRTWRALEEVLARVAPLPLVDAMKRIPGRLLTSFKRPWDSRVFEVWQRHCETVFAGVRGDPGLVSKWSVALLADRSDLEKLLAAPVAHQIAESARAVPVAPQLDEETRAKKWEEFLAMRFVAFVQYIRTHLANFVAVTTAALLPALWATNFYPLRQNRFLLLLVVAVTVVAISVTAFVFVQMNRNYVLSRLARTSPGKVTWNRSFVGSLLIHVAVPVLALLAVKFPELGRAWGAVMATLAVFSGGGAGAG